LGDFLDNFGRFFPEHIWSHWLLVAAILVSRCKTERIIGVNWEHPARPLSCYGFYACDTFTKVGINLFGGKNGSAKM
jgi:hypothetical protein